LGGGGGGGGWGGGVGGVCGVGGWYPTPLLRQAISVNSTASDTRKRLIGELGAAYDQLLPDSPGVAGKVSDSVSVQNVWGDEKKSSLRPVRSSSAINIHGRNLVTRGNNIKRSRKRKELIWKSRWWVSAGRKELVHQRRKNWRSREKRSSTLQGRGLLGSIPFPIKVRSNNSKRQKPASCGKARDLSGRRKHEQYEIGHSDGKGVPPSKMHEIRNPVVTPAQHLSKE